MVFFSCFFPFLSLALPISRRALSFVPFSSPFRLALEKNNNLSLPIFILPKTPITIAPFDKRGPI